MLLTHRPAGPLAAIVHTIWFSAHEGSPHPRERMLPTGCVDIVVPLLQRDVLRYEREDDTDVRRLPGAVVQGPHDRFCVRGTEGPSRAVGVHFRAGGAAALFGGALPALCNRTELLEDLWGRSVRRLHGELLQAPTPAATLQVMERHLLRRLRDASPVDAGVAAALDAFAREPSRSLVEPVQRASGCTPAQFIRRFQQTVGLTPKRYARVLRFDALLSTLVRTSERDWAQIAPAAGYFDQSHLIREFRRIAGVTPAAWVPLHIEQPRHVPIAGSAGAMKKSPIAA